MHRCLALVLLCVLLPLAGLAQDTPPAPAPDAPVAAPPLVSAPEEVEPEPLAPGPGEAAAAPEGEAQGMPPVPRVILETLAGGTGMVAGGLLGLLLSVSTSSCQLIEGDCGTLVPFALGGMVLGSAAGTYLAGSLMKGRGGFLGTLLGSALGTGVGILMLVALGNDESRGTIALLTLPSIGAVTGYELSGFADSPTRFSLTVTRQASPVAPVIGRTPEGGFMGGLVGRF